MKTHISPVLITFALACFALLPKAHGVLPPPDGGYPGFNTAEGQNALQNLTTGSGNTGLGWFSLFSDTTASFNTAVGAGTLLFNNEDSNTAIGAAALLFNTDGSSNTAVGVAALLDNMDGNFNTAVGNSALFNNISGLGNTACGADALRENAIGNGNTANGQLALGNTSGSNNTALGLFAGLQQTTGSNNVYIGADIQGEAGESNRCYIGSIFGQSSPNGLQVVVNSGNRLGTIGSSERFKEQIKPMDSASEALFALKPVTFRYRKDIDSGGTSQFGLVAEDVEKLNPDLVVRDPAGKPYSVRYDQVNAMLLNEFLKEHRTVHELKVHAAKQETILAQQQKQIEALTAGLQKVSAQLELSKSALKTVVNNQ